MKSTDESKPNVKWFFFFLFFSWDCKLQRQRFSIFICQYMLLQLWFRKDNSISLSFSHSSSENFTNFSGISYFSVFPANENVTMNFSFIKKFAYLFPLSYKSLTQFLSLDDAIFASDGILLDFPFCKSASSHTHMLLEQ